jgi:hypothetical protein
MIQVKIKQDIKVFCIQAKSFPDGVMEAFQKLHSLLEFPPQRRNFGISKPEDGKIVYRVAAEELVEGDLKKHNLTEFIIPGGNYIGIKINDFRKDLSQLKIAFNQLLTDPNLDPNSYCIEEYIGIDDVVCMVRLTEGK